MKFKSLGVMLLTAGAVLGATSCGGPRGNDNPFITSKERAEMLEQWEAAFKDSSKSYNPAKYLTDKGYTLKTDEYRTTYSTEIKNLDPTQTYRQSDSAYLCNFIEGLVQYDNLGRMQPACAESWELDSTQTKYTFHIRKGMKWVTNQGAAVADVKAGDFVLGLKRAVDAGYVSYLAEGVVKNVIEYEDGEVEFSQVGIKAKDDYTLEIELVKPESFFLSRLTYNTFMPVCQSQYESKGEDINKSTDTGNNVYNGPFYPTTVDGTVKTMIVAQRNELYWDNEHTTVDRLVWVYDDGSNPAQTYTDVKNGIYAGTGLAVSTGTLALAKKDKLFDDYKYVTDTTATTYFGGLNLNRGTFEVGGALSKLTEAEKILAHRAANNLNFRRGLLHCIDRVKWNEVSRDKEVAAFNLRNTYIKPDFTAIESAVSFTEDGKTYEFPAKSTYGEILQKFLDEKEAHIKVEDGQDGWFDKAYAQECFAKAKQELGLGANDVIKLDNVYYAPSVGQTADHKALQQLMDEGSNGLVKLQLIEANTTADYYYSGYYADSGEDLNNDFYYGSGWGPDFNDGSTYLDTFRRAGDMLTTIGLNKIFGGEEAPEAPAEGKYGREADVDVYERNLGTFEDLMDVAAAETNDSQRLVKYAKAEAELLDKAIVMPNTTEGGNYAITRVAPRSVPHVNWGVCADMLKNIVQIKASVK